MSKIKQLKCHRIINSRGNWTIETEILLENGISANQTIPSGASKGENEAIYVNPEKAIDLIEGPLSDLLVGHDIFDQKKIDELMLKMDGTENKSHLGGNSILSISLAVAKAAAKVRDVELYEYLFSLYNDLTSTNGYNNGSNSFLELKGNNLTFPTPVFNVINGGKHAHNNLSFQEFMVIPAQNIKIDEALEMGVNMYHLLQDSLEKQGYDIDVGDEGGFAPNNLTVEKTLSIIKDAITKKYKVGEQVFFGMDVAAESFYDKKSKEYAIPEEDIRLTTPQLSDMYTSLLKKFEIIYLEDPFYEKDYTGWKEFSTLVSNKLLVVADDLTVTNPKFLATVIKKDLANAVIVKPNQVGSLTETLDFIRTARKNNMTLCISHRSGDTAEDTFIADLAIAVSAEFMKSGAPARGERVAKYNRLLEIYDQTRSN